MHSPRLFQGVRHHQFEEGALALPDSPQKSAGTKNDNLITRRNLQLIWIWIIMLGWHGKDWGSYTCSQWDRWLQNNYYKAIFTQIYPFEKWPICSTFSIHLVLHIASNINLIDKDLNILLRAALDLLSSRFDFTLDVNNGLFIYPVN